MGVSCMAKPRETTPPGMPRRPPTKRNQPRLLLTMLSSSSPLPQLMEPPVPDANTQPRPPMEPKSQDHSARTLRRPHCAAVQPTSTSEMELDLPSRPARLLREPTPTNSSQHSSRDPSLLQPQKCGGSTASRVHRSSPPPLLPSELLTTWSEMFERHMDVNYICETFRE